MVLTVAEVGRLFPSHVITGEEHDSRSHLCQVLPDCGLYPKNIHAVLITVRLLSDLFGFLHMLCARIYNYWFCDFVFCLNRPPLLVWKDREISCLFPAQKMKYFS